MIYYSLTVIYFLSSILDNIATESITDEMPAITVSITDNLFTGFIYKTSIRYIDNNNIISLSVDVFHKMKKIFLFLLIKI